MKRLICSSIFLLIIKSGYTCTAFGIITNTGTIIGKNRDYNYNKQKFELIYPNKQFINWYDNDYNHRNKFYALLSNNDVKMGVNQYGLTAIEEDPLYPAEFNRKYIQPINGNAEGMLLYGILQNFSTIDEIIPYIKSIFSIAAPNFYQIADKHKILIVEVGFSQNNSDRTRPYLYKIIESPNDYFVHSNLYLFPDFISLNKLKGDIDIENGSNYRENKMKELLIHSDFKKQDIAKLFLNTQSTLSKTNDKNWCRNTSIFRSNTKEINHIKVGLLNNNKIYGTVSSLIVSNDVNQSKVDLKMLVSIDTLKNGDQKIVYDDLKIKLSDLFTKKEIIFSRKSFIRKAPYNGKCTWLLM